eukprot:gene8920-10452_t
MIRRSDFIGFRSTLGGFTTSDNKFLEFTMNVIKPATGVPVVSVYSDSVTTPVKLVLNNNTDYTNPNFIGGTWQQVRIRLTEIGINSTDMATFNSLRISSSLRDSFLQIGVVNLKSQATGTTPPGYHIETTPPVTTTTTGPQMTDKPDKEKKDSSLMGKIVAGVLVPLAVIIVIVAIIVMKKKNSKKRLSSYVSKMYDNETYSRTHPNSIEMKSLDKEPVSSPDAKPMAPKNKNYLPDTTTPPSPPPSIKATASIGTITHQESTQYATTITTYTNIQKQSIANTTIIDIQRNQGFHSPLSAGLRDSSSNVPYIITITTEHLARHGLQEQGILRQAGSKTQVNAYVAQLDAGHTIDLSTCADVNVVGDLLKKYFRELPEPILSRSLSSKIDYIVNLEDTDQQVSSLTSLVNSLDIITRSSLHSLFAFLSLVSKSSMVNKMNNSNLSLVFSPTLQLIL